MTMWYNLKFKNAIGETINFTDWEKETIDTLNEHKNIKKVWLVNRQRKTGATYFAKLLMFFRPPCTSTFVISHNLDWSKYIANRGGCFSINFWVEDKRFNKYSEWYKASNFLTPVTLFGLEKEVKENKKSNEMLMDLAKSYSFSISSYPLSYECLYDNEFNIKTYNYLLSYNFNFLVINVSSKDLEKARPFIEADKDEEDVLIVNIENSLFPDYFQNNKEL